MQEKIDAIKNSIGQWPDTWPELLEFLKNKLNIEEPHFWENLVRVTLTAENELEDNYQTFFKHYWTDIRPEMNSSAYPLITAAEHGLDILVMNQLRGLSSEQQLTILGVTTKNKDTALHYAVRNGKLLTSELLINKGASVNARGFNGDTPLHLAVYNGSTQLVALLLAKRADLNIANTEGKKPIHLAAAFGYPEIVDQIISLDNEQLNTRGSYGGIPFYEAACCDQLAVMKKLLDSGKPDYNYINSNTNDNAMHYAVKNANFEMVNLLIAMQIDINLQDRSGLTPLHYAVSTAIPSVEIIETLLENGAEVNIGETPPLYLLTSFVDEALVSPEAETAAQLLLNHKAEIDSSYGEAFFDNYTTSGGPGL